MVLRLLPRFRSRPLPNGLSDGRLRLRPLWGRNLGQDPALRRPQRLHADLQHQRRPAQILRHGRGHPLPGRLRRPEPFLGFAAEGHGFGPYPHVAAGEKLHHLYSSRVPERHDARSAENGLRPPFAARCGRFPNGTREAAHVDRTRLEPPHNRRTTDLVDRIPPFATLPRAGQFPARRPRPREKTPPHRTETAQCPLPDPDRAKRRPGLGGIYARRTLHDRRRRFAAAAHRLAHAGLLRSARTGLGQCDRTALHARHRRFGHVDRPNRTRRRLAGCHPRRLHHAERPAGRRRQALLRLDRLGPRRSPLLRPRQRARIPSFDFDLWQLLPGSRRRRSRLDDHLRPKGLPHHPSGKHRTDSGRPVATARRSGQSAPPPLERGQSRHGTLYPRRFGLPAPQISGTPLPQGIAPAPGPQLGPRIVRPVQDHRRVQPPAHVGRHYSLPKSAVEHRGLRIVGLEPGRRPCAERYDPVQRPRRTTGGPGHLRRRPHDLWHRPAGCRRQGRAPAGPGSCQILVGGGRRHTAPLFRPGASYPTALALGGLGVFERNGGRRGCDPLRRRGTHRQPANARLPRRAPQTLAGHRLLGRGARRLPRRRDPLGLYALGRVRPQPRKPQLQRPRIGLRPDLHPRVLPPQLPLRSGGLPNLRRRLPLPVGSAIPRLQIDPAAAPGLLLVRHFEQ